jgi:hypothetical protein
LATNSITKPWQFPSDAASNLGQHAALAAAQSCATKRAMRLQGLTAGVLLPVCK